MPLTRRRQSSGPCAHARRHAFTLVELLVVIGIIALLISILLPALNKARRQAATLKCATQLREIGNAFRYYAGEYRNFYPPAKLTLGTDNYALGNYDFTSAFPPYWINFLSKYVTKGAVGASVQNAADANDVKNRSVIWGCTNWDAYQRSGANATAGFNVVQTGYGMNAYPYYSNSFSGPFTVDQVAIPTGATPTWTKATSSLGFVKAGAWGKNGAERMLVTESKYFQAWAAAPSINSRGVNATYVEAQSGDIANTTTDPQAYISFWRHGKLPANEGTSGAYKYPVWRGTVAFNILYADGHVSTATDSKDGFRSFRMKYPG